MIWSIRLGIIFTLLELVWVFFWFGVLIPFNTQTEVPPELEASHFTGALHLLGLPILIWTVYVLQKYHKGEEREEPTHLRWHVIAMLGVAFLDCRGVMHVALRYPIIGIDPLPWFHRLFAGVACMALILTGLELLWLTVITIKWWPRIFNDLAEMWGGSSEGYNKMNDALLIPITKRNHAGLKDF
jgi:hypothetical protein